MYKKKTLSDSIGFDRKKSRIFSCSTICFFGFGFTYIRTYLLYTIWYLLGRARSSISFICLLYSIKILLFTVIFLFLIFIYCTLGQNFAWSRVWSFISVSLLISHFLYLYFLYLKFFQKKFVNRVIRVKLENCRWLF